MRVEIKKDHLIIVPESHQDNAFIEDTLKVEKSILFEKINTITMGVIQNDQYVLKSKQAKESEK